MTGRTWVMVSILLLSGYMLFGTGQAEAGDLAGPVDGGSRIARMVNAPQMQEVTPPPQPPEADEANEPIASEAGRDYGLIVGAVVLVLIVLAGLIYGVRSQAKHKARD